MEVLAGIIDPYIIEVAFRFVLAAVFAYVGLAGFAASVKYAMLDQEIRKLAEQQVGMLEALKEVMLAQAEEKKRKKDELKARIEAAMIESLK